MSKRNGNGKSLEQHGKGLDYLHAVLYVRRTMPKGIRTVVRGFWQGAKKLGRAYSAASCIAPNKLRENYQEGVKNLKEETVQLEVFSVSLCKQMGNEAYYQLEPVFTEMPFIRPMGRNTQLPNTIRYIDMNPQRLATKRLKPGFFRVQKDIIIGNRSYDASKRHISRADCIALNAMAEEITSSSPCAFHHSDS